jgi:hypothetical protein
VELPSQCTCLELLEDIWHTHTSIATTMHSPSTRFIEMRENFSHDRFQKKKLNKYVSINIELKERRWYKHSKNINLSLDLHSRLLYFYRSNWSNQPTRENSKNDLRSKMSSFDAWHYSLSIEMSWLTKYSRLIKESTSANNQPIDSVIDEIFLRTKRQ